MTNLLAAAWAVFLLMAAPAAGVLPSPTPIAPAGVLPTPVPLPSLPPILPGPSPTPTPAAAAGGTHGSGTGQTGATGSTGGFGSGGIAGAFQPTDVSASTGHPQTDVPPPAYQPVAPP